MSEPIYNVPRTYLDEIRELEEILLWGKPLKDMEHINFVHVEEGSQFFVKLSGIIQTVKSLRKRLRDKHTKKKTYPSENGERIYCYGTSIKEDVDYLLKGLENSIKNGYEIAQDDLIIKSPPIGGYAVVTIPIRSLIVPPGMEKEWAEKVLRDLPPVVDADGPRILTQGELNQFKKVEEEKTKALEDHLFKPDSAKNKSPIELASPYVRKFNEEMAKANKEVYPDDFSLYDALAGKKIKAHKLPDLDKNKETNTGQKFPPVMYSPDGRKYYKSERTTSQGPNGRYEGISKEGKKTSWFYSELVKNGFTEYKPMRSRGLIETALQGMQQRLNTASERRLGMCQIENLKDQIGLLSWVLNKDDEYLSKYINT